VQRDNASILLLWEWIVYAGKAECLVVRVEKGIKNDLPYGINASNPNPGSATD